jgi:nucleoside diphosphate kinase
MSDPRWREVVERARGEVREGVALTELLEQAGAEERAGLGRLSLVVLRPDSITAGRGADIIEHLAGLGAAPVAIRVLELTPALVDAAYHRQPKIPRDHVWIHTAALSGGPAAALLVAGQDGLTESLYAAKGPTSTLLDAPPGSLRRVFGRTSSTHAVIHIPENLAAFVAEATLLFPWETLLRNAVEPAVLPSGVAEELVAVEPLPGRLVFQAVVKVKRRIAAALAARLGADVVAPLRHLTVRADRALEGLGYLDQRERLLAFAGEERPLLGAVLAEADRRLEPCAGATRGAAWRELRERTGAVELATASWFLTGHEAYGGDGGERLFAALADNDVPLTPGQRTLLASALAHDLHPGARFDGERAWPLGHDPGGAVG